MNRIIYSTLILTSIVTLSSLSKAHAGFEWVPPVKNPAPILKSVNVQEQMQAPVKMAPMSDMSSTGFPAPSVTAEPLNNPAASMSGMPTSILPQQQVSRPAPQQNLSGKKLFIDPYPLENKTQRPNVSQPDPTEVYKAMNEKAGKLHPVELGNGLSTGAKPYKAAPVPKAIRTASTAHKTFLTPTNGTGMTPMMGAEPAPLPGILPKAAAPRVEQNRIFAEAVGFGRDLPLALALSQVIPSEFTHSFATDVNPGVTVSWEGGKPWDNVLNDMLRAEDLTAVIRDNQVTIQPMAKL